MDGSGYSHNPFRPVALPTSLDPRFHPLSGEREALLLSPHDARLQQQPMAARHSFTINQSVRRPEAGRIMGKGRLSWPSDGSSTETTRCTGPIGLGEQLASSSTPEARLRFDRSQPLPQQTLGGNPSDQSIDWSNVTTLMLRNLPRRYTEDALLSELAQHVERDSFDFLYMPWDNRRGSNMGYAFVNFVEVEQAQRVYHRLNGQRWRLIYCPKEIKVLPAHLQGLIKNLAHYYGSTVVENGHVHSPIVLHKGQRIDFQVAVKMFCPPDFLQQYLQTMREENKGSGASADGTDDFEEARFSNEEPLRGRSYQDPSDDSVLYSDYEGPPGLEMQNPAGSLPRNGDIPLPSFTSGDENETRRRVLGSRAYMMAWTRTNQQLELLLQRTGGTFRLRAQHRDA